jgi:hypothetical protein
MKQNEIWLLFRDGNHPLRYFLKKNFGHVYVLMRDHHGFWILVDPAHTHLDITALNYKREDDVPRLLMQNKGVKVLRIKFEVGYKRKQGISLLSVMNCVSIAKYAIALRLCAFTPYQLYKRLVKMEQKQRYKSGIDSVTQFI